jgi:uncharacterized membrane protein YqiK
MDTQPKSDPRPSMVAGARPYPANPVDPNYPANANFPATAYPADYADEPTVTMIFPERTQVQLDDGAGVLTFEKGIQEVPESLAAHWYVRRVATTYTRTPTEARLLEQQRADRAKAEEDAAAAAQKAADDEVANAEATATAEVEAAKAKAEAKVAAAKNKAATNSIKVSAGSRPNTPATPTTQVATQKHVAFLQKRGYDVNTVAEAQKFVDGLTPKERTAFFVDSAAS